MRIIFLSLFIFISLTLGNKLVRSGDYVLDDTNRLMWQDSYDTVKVRLDQPNAVKYCEKLSFAGFSDWRLPNREEYKTIIDITRKKELKIDKAFKYILPENYWTSDRTWIRNFGLYGYYVYFKSGAIYYQNRTLYKKFVRCVRSLK
jgi:hypothetical protein